MELIPVIDIKGGQVVQAQGGRRDAYRPIRTPLSATSDPPDVTASLLRQIPSSCIYVADIDAIERRPPNATALQQIATTAPSATIWVDTGVASLASAEAWLAARQECLVVGSESQTDTDLISSLRDHPRIVLSLDFRGDAFQGPHRLLQDDTLWPAHVIVMTLARVGESQGPDLSRVASIVRRAGGRQVYAAGGVRNVEDLRALASIGAAGALVATALHRGAITARDLAALV